MSRAECERLFEALEGTPRLMAELMFGSGVRLLELLRLRVKDVDLERGQLVVRAGKGDQDRVTVLPERLQEKLRAHRERLRRLHVEDRAKELPGVWLPEGLERKWPWKRSQNRLRLVKVNSSWWLAPWSFTPVRLSLSVQ